MKYYTSTTEYNCGIDLHAHQMYVCVMDRQGKKLVHCNVKDNDFDYFLTLVKPYRHDLTVCAECMFGWYWLSDACQEAGLTFVLAHALYLHLIHGGKNKNDRIDSEKIAHLLRSNLIPPSYVYPAAKDFLSYCRLVKGTVASAGKIKGLRGAKLGNPYLRWAFGEAAVIAKRDHYRLKPLAQALETRLNGNKFKANTVIAIKLARAAYFMLKNKTVFDPDRLTAALAKAA